jgi:hypothetical protein
VAPPKAQTSTAPSNDNVDKAMADMQKSLDAKMNHKMNELSQQTSAQLDQQLAKINEDSRL